MLRVNWIINQFQSKQCKCFLISNIEQSYPLFLYKMQGEERPEGAGTGREVQADTGWVNIINYIIVIIDS